MLERFFVNSLFRNACLLSLVVFLACVLPACNKPKGIPEGVNAQLLGENFQVGNDIEVRFSIGGLSQVENDSLSGFDLNVLFDSSVLTFKSSTFIDPDSTLNQLEQTEEGALPFDGKVADSGTGVLDVYAVSGNQGVVLDTVQADDFVFLTLTFTAIAAAESTTVALDTADSGLLFAASNDTAMAQTYPEPSVEFEVQAP